MTNVVTLRNDPTPAQRAARHLEQAKQLANEQIRLLVDQMSTMRGVADEIARGGPIYPAGVRELSTRFQDELEQRAKSIQSIMQWPELAEPASKS